MIRPTPEITTQRIELVAIGSVDPAVLEGVTPGLVQRFRITTTRGQPIPIDPNWFDPTRNQYLAGPILDAIVDEQRGNTKILGVVDADIYAPGLNFIFGQAIVGGCCALIGLARLRPEFHQQEPQPEVFARRVLIEAVHELGHTVGLDHCPDPHCVMHFSRTIEDTDRKGPDFCQLCQDRHI